MPIFILLIPLMACTADIAPRTIREANAIHQHWLQLKQANIHRIEIETLRNNSGEANA